MLSASSRNQPGFPLEIKSNTRITKLKKKTKTKKEKQKQTNKQKGKTTASLLQEYLLL